MFEILKFLLVSVKVDDHKSHLTNHFKTGPFPSQPFLHSFFSGAPICVLLEWTGAAFLRSKSFWFYVISGYEDLMGDWCISKEISDIPPSVIITSYILYNFSNALFLLLILSWFLISNSSFFLTVFLTLSVSFLVILDAPVWSPIKWMRPTWKAWLPNKACGKTCISNLCALWVCGDLRVLCVCLLKLGVVYIWSRLKDGVLGRTNVMKRFFIDEGLSWNYVVNFHCDYPCCTQFSLIWKLSFLDLIYVLLSGT